MKHRLRRRVVLLAAVTALIASLGGGAAYAYFKSTGSGNAGGNSGTLGPVTLTTAATPTKPLVPGGSGDVTLTINNSNTFNVSLVSVALNGTITAVGNATCSASTGVTFTPYGPPSPVITLTPGTNHVDLPAAASMSPTGSVSACQGATFSIPVEITVQK
jgi:hypothetical protein